MRIRRLKRVELPIDTVTLARFLIGKVLVYDPSTSLRRVGRIVETEAYPPDDPACHAFNGETKRNASMFLRHGHAYVYFSYGVHWIFNVSSETVGVGGAVLIRALEPLSGVEHASNGPGKLTVAMGFAGELDGVDLCADSALWLGQVDRAVAPIMNTARIGISKAVQAPLRFCEAGNFHLSRRTPR